MTGMAGYCTLQLLAAKLIDGSQIASLILILLISFIKMVSQNSSSFRVQHYEFTLCLKCAV